MTRTTSPTRSADHHAALGGVEFHWRDIGHPSAPPVVMLHGIMGHSREWDSLFARMVPDHRVIALDQRGHGASEWAPPYTAARMAGDAIALIEHLGFTSTTLIGHSMGGMAAMLAAAGAPTLIDHLVIIDIGPDAFRQDFAAEAPIWMRQMADTIYDNVDQAVEEWRSGNPLARDDLLRHYVTHCLVPVAGGGLRWRFDALGLISFFTDGTTETELWQALDHIVCPTLVLRGEHSYMLSEQTQALMVDRLADPATAVIPGGGHDLGVEQPEAVADAIREFLDRTTDAAGSASHTGPGATPQVG